MAGSHRERTVIAALENWLPPSSNRLRLLAASHKALCVCVCVCVYLWVGVCKGVCQASEVKGLFYQESSEVFLLFEPTLEQKKKEPRVNLLIHFDDFILAVWTIVMPVIQHLGQKEGKALFFFFFYCEKALFRRKLQISSQLGVVNFCGFVL